ncbi:MAG: hypothetical protein AVDCRST_MAG89-1934 [uncultured Gemmatimonadetes bacterium]|uniref:Uncharacterized protein n=1 Tax=uncultured Gemmatimonadota bacterium TaxID=203437 RepID=A0A6J4LA63_9BACT|nr:MAG: hypothetical protein AVDCRST_MAG89-1934 [uncultured Gemmatimonadota bacterium]
MNFEDNFRDLAPLDPSRDTELWESMVGKIAAAAQPELARRASMPAPGMLLLLQDWIRPAISTAALIAAVAGAILIAQPSSTSSAPGMADALGYPETVATWIEGGQAPSVEELVFALEGDM